MNTPEPTKLPPVQIPKNNEIYVPDDQLEAYLRRAGQSSTTNDTAEKSEAVKRIEAIATEKEKMQDKKQARVKAILEAYKHNQNSDACIAELEAAGKECGFMTDVDNWMKTTIESGALINRNTPEPPQVLKGVLYKEGRLMITGGAKSYKTWLLLRLAICISEGINWIGIEAKKGKVLYVGCELSDYLLEDRLKKVYNEVFPNTTPSGNLVLKNIDEVSASAKQFLELLPDLATHLKKEGYTAVIIDPIYSLYDAGIDENSASDIKRMLDTLKRFGNKSGCAVIYSHHHTKGGQGKKDAIDRSSGSGVFKRHPTAIIDFTELETENDECEDFVMSFKLTGFARRKKAGVRIINGYKVVLDSSLKLDRVKDPTKFKASFTEANLLNPLQAQKYKASDLKKTVCEDAGMSSATFDRLWKTVKTKDGVSEDSEHYWKYTHPMYQPIPKISSNN